MSQKTTTLLLLAFLLSAGSLSAQFVIKPTFFETLGISNQGIISGYESQAGPYSLWDADNDSFYEIGGAAPGNGIGGSVKFSGDGIYLSGTNLIEQMISTDWTRNVLSDFNYIFKEIQFPDNQPNWGYAAGESLTSNGSGIILKSADGGNHWIAKWVDSGQHGLESMSFPTQYTGYVCGWNGYLAKSTDGAESWTPLAAPSPTDAIWYYRTINFKDENNGILTAQLEEGYAVYYTADGGETWSTATGVTGVVGKSCYAGGDTYYAVNLSGGIQKSTDNGATWTTAYTAPGMLLGIRFFNETTGIATGERYCYKTTDAGETWTQIDVQEGVLFRDVNWIDADHIVVVGAPDAIFFSDDAGATWTWANQDIFNGGPSLYSIAVTPENVHVCGSQGNFYKKSLISSRIVAEMSRYNTTTGQWSALGNLGQTVDNTTSAGYCISADGNTVVGNSWADPANGNGYSQYAHGFLWNQTEGTVDLGSLYANLNRSSRANAVSGNGNVVVGLQDLNGPWKSAVWRKNPAGGYFPNEYILLDPSGSATDEFNQMGECSYVTADGNWIGGEGDYANGNQPWIWSEATGVINLGDLSDGAGTGRVAGISPDGSMVVGWFSVFGWGALPIPFIWTASGGIQEFNEYVNNTLNMDTGDYQIYIPNNLSENGKFVTGWGVNPTIGEWGELFTFRLQIPDELGVPGNELDATTVYPNPSNGILNIQASIGIDRVEVYNTNGQLLMSQKQPSVTQIDLSALSNGVYFVKTYSGELSKTHKVVKQ